ncbi:hypothetical protein PSP6_450034 [Paraburkholderia tropica]|nr:hypothetical protein PSP6_450034 [Paraburkholderia tropica]
MSRGAKPVRSTMPAQAGSAFTRRAASCAVLAVVTCQPRLFRCALNCVSGVRATYSSTRSSSAAGRASLASAAAPDAAAPDAATPVTATSGAALPGRAAEDGCWTAVKASRWLALAKDVTVALRGEGSRTIGLVFIRRCKGSARRRRSSARRA